MIKTRTLITSALLALWFLSVHHCVFEFFLDNGKVATQESSQTSGDNDCQSHGSSDPSSHKEGTPCNPLSIKVSETSFTDVKLILALSFFFSNDFRTENIEHAKIFLPKELDSFTPLVTRNSLTSLTIASNAPPFLA